MYKSISRVSGAYDRKIQKGEKKGIEGGSSEGECTFGGRDMWFGPGVDQCAILSDEVGELEEEMTFELHIGVAV
jgi:hypothetical protein